MIPPLFHLSRRKAYRRTPLREVLFPTKHPEPPRQTQSRKLLIPKKQSKAPRQTQLREFIFPKKHQKAPPKMEDLSFDIEVIHTIRGVKSLADGIAVLNASHRNESPLLYFDIDPQSLSPNGELNLLAIVLCHGPGYQRRLYLVDVHRLANQAFSSRGYYGASLRSILDSASYQKVLFDVGYHSHVLYNQYGIKLQGVTDLQLMDNARRRNRQNLESFEPLVNSLLAHGRNRSRWLVDKFNGEWSYKNCAGAPHQVFQERPLSTYIRLYCCRNIQFMPELYDKIRRAMPRIMDLVAEMSQRRIEESQEDGYDPSAGERLRSPWTDEQYEELERKMGPMFIDLRLGRHV